jgi:putative proteasome-type protease
MTYCLGMMLREGLVMMADTRTNAGIDNLASYRKLRLLGQDGVSMIAVASAGSLSTTQIAMERAVEGMSLPPLYQLESLADVDRIHRAAYLLGQAVKKTSSDWRQVTQGDLALDASLLVGGSVGHEKTRLFMIYGEGNFIECCPDTPFLQIGERKFGQPILDEALSYETELYEAMKIGLVSFIMTMRSNRAVDLPIDVVVVRSGETFPEFSYRFTEDDPYYRELDRRWGQTVQAALATIPPPPPRQSEEHLSQAQR